MTTPLTPRESEIAALIAEGLSNADIPRRLTLPVRTVDNHVSHVLDRRQLGSRSAAASWVVRRVNQRDPLQRGSTRYPIVAASGVPPVKMDPCRRCEAWAARWDSRASPSVESSSSVVYAVNPA